jgi:hypothetical protein
MQSYSQDIWPHFTANISSTIFHRRIADMSRSFFPELQGVQGADPANKLSLLQLGKSSSSWSTSRTRSSDSKGYQDFTARESVLTNLSLCRCNISPEECCSKCNTCYTRRLKKAQCTYPLVWDSKQQEEARYLAMFRDFYGIPTTTKIA